MKVAIVTDTHFGMKKGSEVFLESQLKFFTEQFVPYLKENNIDTILHLGDFFDNRVNIDSKVLNAVIDLFENHLRDFTIHIIVGNHDSYLESSVHINSVNTLALFENVKVYSDISQIEIDNRQILMCPWITDKEEFMDIVENSTADICAGHFAISKIPMFKGIESEHGMESSIFLTKFKLTLSGHYHTRSTTSFNGNTLCYVGNAFQMTRADIDDERGFSILDLDTLQLEFIENTTSLKFVSLKYPKIVTQEYIQGNHVDLFVEYDDNYNELKVQSYIEKLESYNPAFPVNVKTINKIAIESEEDIEITSISDLIKEYLENSSISNPTQKESIKKLVLELYEVCVSEI